MEVDSGFVKVDGEDDDEDEEEEDEEEEMMEDVMDYNFVVVV